MKRTTSTLFIVAFLVTSSAIAATAKKLPQNRVRFEATPAKTFLPQDLVGQTTSPRATAAADTFVLGDFSFEKPGGGLPDEMGFVHVDRTTQEPYFHVADDTELNGGTFGNLLPIAGSQSMWCGQAPSTAIPFCGYATLPGYGNDWNQMLQSDFVSGDSLVVSYEIFWDSEGGYDETIVQVTFDAGATWANLPVTDTLSTAPMVYDNTGIPGGITETFNLSGPGGTDNIALRFRFSADGAWSDEDGLWPTDGAVIVDNINVEHFSGGTSLGDDFEDFESAPPGSNSAGIWSGTPVPAFGDFADLYPGVAVVQEDPCTQIFLFVWGFFDDPLRTNYNCHTPNPLPLQGAIPFGTADGVYIQNEVWSPRMANIGSGNEYRLSFLVYQDLPLDNLQFYTWAIRSWNGGCPGMWRNFTFVYYGWGRNWLRALFSVGSLVDPAADEVQVSIGVVDMCPYWCNIYGSGTCHSHAPLYDDLSLKRVQTFGPQFTVRHINLFQDNFASDGTLTGTARADAAIDILPSASPGIVPGDSVVVTVSPVGAHLGVEGGPAVYTYVTVQPFGQAGKTPADLEAPELRGGSKRYPLVGTTVVNGVTWAQFRMDSAITTSGSILADQYAIDLNDNVLTPGDTIHYFFGADASASAGDENYFTRTLNGQGADFVSSDINETFASPMEFTILPAGGYNRGGDILYVDDVDDRGGPAQRFFDTTFDMMAIREMVDRYDTMGPSSAVGNELGSRVTNNVAQIIDVYQKILWNSGNLSSATMGDGTGNPEKSDSFGLLFQFLNTSTKGHGPGLYMSGDDIAEEWVTLAGPGAIALRSLYMNFNYLGPSHISHGEAVSPTLTALSTGPWGHSGSPDKLVVYGGCPLINDFDVLSATGKSINQWPYPNSGDAAVLSQRTANAAGDTAAVVLSGFSYNYIRDALPFWPPARAEFMHHLFIFLKNALGEIDGIEPGSLYTNALYNNYPNPFNPVTTIRYSIRERAHVSLEIYNAAGQLVKTLVNQVQTPEDVGPVTWDGTNNTGQTVSSGVYFYRLVTKNYTQTKKMVLLK